MLSSWFPCALLVTDEKDSSESLWPCITKWTLMELNLLTTLMNVFHGFFLLECSNDFKRIMQIWACAVKLFENVQNLLAFSHSIVNQKIHLKIHWLIGQYRWLLCQFQLQNSNSNEGTILSHGMLEVVATRHKLRRLWGRIVPSNFRNQIKSTQILTKQAPKANEKFLDSKTFSLSNCT